MQKQCGISAMKFVYKFFPEIKAFILKNTKKNCVLSDSSPLHIIFSIFLGTQTQTLHKA